MNSELQNFVERIVGATKLKGKTRVQLFKELCSHINEEERELQLQGCSKQKIVTVIQERWGNIESMSKELSEVHATKYTRRIEIGIIIFMLLSAVYIFFGGCSKSGTVVMPPPQPISNSTITN